MRVATAIKRAGSVRQLAAILGVSTQAVYKMRKKPDLPKEHADVVRSQQRRA